MARSVSRLSRAQREGLAEARGEQRLQDRLSFDAFVRWVAAKDWSLLTRDGKTDFVDERTLYAWQGWSAAPKGDLS